MPFGTPQPPPSTRRATKDNGYPKEDLIKLGGLYPSKSGKALTGNSNMNYVLKSTEIPVGETLIETIKQAMDEDRPLRFLVFENNGRFPGAPYSLHVAMGTARPVEGAEAEEGPPAPPVEDTPPPRRAPGPRVAPRR